MINLLRELGGVARAIGFVNGFCGEAFGTSAALCSVYEYSRCVTSPILRRGDRVIHFALQALQLHATPANPSPHTPRVHPPGLTCTGLTGPRDPYFIALFERSVTRRALSSTPPRSPPLSSPAAACVAVPRAGPFASLLEEFRRRPLPLATRRHPWAVAVAGRRPVARPPRRLAHVTAACELGHSVSVGHT